MAKNYNPPPKINEHAGIKLLDDKKRQTEGKMIRVDAIRMAIEVMSSKEDGLDNIINEAKKIENFIEYGQVPAKVENKK
tara:strand:+ start:319 stop:555 length:237 start_codon:yes stop_codon:yes gene_type:complete